MIPIATKSYSEIYEASVKKASEFKILKTRRDEKRALLSSSEQEHLDILFLNLYKQIISEESKDTNQLQELLDRGAKTTFFATNELILNGNFAIDLETWLPLISLENKYKSIAETFLICIEAGNAFLTCKYYVGNGGILSICAIAEHLIKRDDSTKLDNPQEKKNNLDFSILILTKMVIHAEDDLKFWGNFYFSLQLISKYAKKESDAQNNAIRFGLAHFVYAKPDIIFQYFNIEADIYYSFQELCKAIFTASHLINEFLEAANKCVGIFGNKDLCQKMNMILSKTWKDLYGMFLISRESRKTTAHILETSSWLRNQFLSHPESVFKFILEKEILVPLLKKEKNRMLSLRNNTGDDLLITLSKVNGRTEKMALLFLQYGFRANTINNDNETALSIAQKRKNSRLVAVLSKNK